MHEKLKSALKILSITDHAMLQPTLLKVADFVDDRLDTSRERESAAFATLLLDYDTAENGENCAHNHDLDRDRPFPPRHFGANSSLSKAAYGPVEPASRPSTILGTPESTLLMLELVPRKEGLQGAQSLPTIQPTPTPTVRRHFDGTPTVASSLAASRG